MKFIIDEDLSPRVARYLCQEFCFVLSRFLAEETSAARAADAIAVRDRGLLGATDPEVLAYALKEDRILITANIRDFEKLAGATEIHAGIVLMLDGDLRAAEQIELMVEVVRVLQVEFAAGKDLVNRVLYISISGTARFENIPE
jgi:predicted nuclease of predicted toxin-antitoxin system